MGLLCQCVVFIENFSAYKLFEVASGIFTNNFITVPVYLIRSL